MRLTVSQVTKTSEQLELDLNKICQNSPFDAQQFLAQLSDGKLFCSTFNDRHIAALAIDSRGRLTAIAVGEPNRRRGVGSDLITQASQLLSGELEQLCVETPVSAELVPWLAQAGFVQAGSLWCKRITGL
ncbi:acetyl-CoA sensor PanZ family protein [Paraferrimonas sedimenticola]|uniref:PanZ acetyltransferase (GNAT) domain-containing protein n=1 Tax=Paraferrimonas sedimenticola TaxID=375674 RepID=A0AA37W2L7_9GAMM|nr:acetyl-CoA sensor PanZ family protein [Paraferrimonas sedimenticola]GLP97768.1 hypothetical protein GCM10007895_30750 [Paraferrimonas sedimenticola]